MKHNMGQLNNLFTYFSNKETIDQLISVKKPCILRYAKKKKKKKKELEIFRSFFDLVSKA